MLFISPLWPERSSSAAGVRTSDLVRGFQEWGWPVAYLCPAARNEHSQLLEDSGVAVIACPMNRRAGPSAAPADGDAAANDTKLVDLGSAKRTHVCGCAGRPSLRRRWIRCARPCASLTGAPK